MLKFHLVTCLTELVLVLPLALVPGDNITGVDTKADEKKAAAAADDATFVRMASASDLAEIAMGRVATQNASSPAVKAFGEQMIKDHTQSSMDLKEAAKKGNHALSTELSPHHQKMLDMLSVLKGADFDRMYMLGQVKDHEAAVMLFREEATRGQDAAVKAFAAKTLPVIEHHLQMARDIVGKTK